MPVVSELKRIRKLHNCSQQRMANDLGISVRTISKIECDKCKPSLEVALLIANYLETDVGEIFHLD